MKLTIPPKLRHYLECAWYIALMILSVLFIISIIAAGVSHGILKFMFYYKFVFGTP